MPSECGISAPWRNLPSGMTSSSRPPSAVQSRRASSTSLSDCESQSARLRPRSQLSSTMAATWRPLPAPVPSPSIQPRRNRTGAESVSPSSVTKAVSILFAVLVAAAVDGLPARADAVVGGEVARMGLPRQHHALELGVGQQPVGHHALGTNGAVSRHGMGHGGHRAGLHERGRVLDGARHPRDARAPRLVGAGGGRGGGCACTGLRRRRLDGELDDRTPVMGGPRRRGRRLPGLRRRDRIAEEVAAGDCGGRGPDRL